MILSCVATPPSGEIKSVTIKKMVKLFMEKGALELNNIVIIHGTSAKGSMFCKNVTILLINNSRIEVNVQLKIIWKIFKDFTVLAQSIKKYTATT